MRTSIAILGRQPALGIAELESLFGSSVIEPFGDHCLVRGVVEKEMFKRIGGSIRIGIVITEIQTTKWREIEKYILDNAVDSLLPDIEGKLTFGISSFGLKISGREVAKTALLLKKTVKAAGRSVRMVPHKSVAHNAATVLHNKLTGDKGVELLVVSNGEKTLLGYTTAIQNIDAYAARDQQRPMRDAKVGMLPPKLAQIIINLASGTRSGTLRVLDPFCGTGVLLQEATLMDYDVHGSDIEPRMVDYSIKNLAWLDQHYPDDGDYRRIEIADATTHQWHDTDKIDAVACETFLGQPLTTLPPSDQLAKIMREANEVNHKFLRNISSQLRSGTRLCVAVPTWRGKREFLHLSAIDYLDELGYTRLIFKHVRNEELIYHREGQVVGRELLVLEKR